MCYLQMQLYLRAFLLEHITYSIWILQQCIIFKFMILYGALWNSAWSNAQSTQGLTSFTGHDERKLCFGLFCLLWSPHKIWSGSTYDCPNLKQCYHICVAHVNHYTLWDTSFPKWKWRYNEMWHNWNTISREVTLYM